MDIQQIQYFLEVVQSGNFSAAAENLYTTQSSVSKNIKSLEKELDVQLFDRSKRQIQLTESGYPDHRRNPGNGTIQYHRNAF